MPGVGLEEWEGRGRGEAGDISPPFHAQTTCSRTSRQTHSAHNSLAISLGTVSGSEGARRHNVTLPACRGMH